MNITQELADRVLQVVDQGLCAGVGSPTPGNMCVEAAVCFALGERHWDNPSCVDPVLRTLNLRLNDVNWNSNKARARGLRRLAVAQLGTAGTLDQSHFAAELVRMTISNLLPKALRIAAALQQEPHKSNLLDAARRCETEGTWAEANMAATWAAARAEEAAARAAEAIADRAAYAAARAAEAIADRAAYAAARAAEAAAFVAAVAANEAASAAWLLAVRAAVEAAARAAAASDRLLADFAEEVVQILIKMNTPGSSFLSLTEKEGQKQFTISGERQ